MAKWKYLIADEGGDFFGTNDREQAERYADAEGHFAVVDVVAGKVTFGDFYDFDEIEEAEKLEDEDQGEDEVDPSEESDE